MALNFPDPGVSTIYTADGITYTYDAVKGYWRTSTLDAGIATAGQGALADSAVQPGDNVSDLINDAGYLIPGDNVSDLINDAGYLTSVTELTQVQVEDDTSTVFGQVSGQRLGQAVATNAPADQGFTESLGAADSTGYTAFPNGLIVQWGRTLAASGTTVTFTLPIAFTTAHIGGVAAPNRTAAVSGSYSAYYDNTSVTQGRVTNDSVTATTALNMFWICWGY